MPSQQQQEESIASEVLSASLGGAVSASILYPLEVLKTKMQAENSAEEDDEEKECTNGDDKEKKKKNLSEYSMIEYAQHVYDTEGISVFFSGMSTSAFQSATEKALYFFAYTFLKNSYRRVSGQKNMSTATSLLLGCMAEWAHLPVTLPLDCWTSAIQTNSNPNKGSMELLTTILSEKGLSGMYKGIQTYVVLCLKPALQYTVFEQLRQRLLKGRSSLSAAEAFVLGMVARTVATIAVFPYLRAKVLLQTSTSSSSVVGVLKENYAKGGPAVLFRGLGPELTRGVLSSALMLMIKERLASVVHLALYGKPQHQFR